jgi:UDP-3-O-[3-hydroxymyristoyl] N-acetylglucosamine deacetylase
MNQYTIGKSVSCTGIGLHSGQKVNLCFHPVHGDAGILFLRRHGNKTTYIKACPRNVVETKLSTTLGEDGVTISTVEHVLAAIRGLGLDNIIIEVDGDEVPILDGSAASFVFLLRQAGFQKQKQAKKIALCDRELLYEDGQRKIAFTPYHGLRIRYHIDFSHPLIGKQDYEYCGDTNEFISSLARARTFGFMHEIETLQKNGLVQGGALENALVFDSYGVVNADGMRFSDEPVRHKLLDFIGDIGNYPETLWGSFDVWCSGHSFNNQFLRYLEDNAHKYLKPVEIKTKKREHLEWQRDEFGVPAFV